MAIIRRGRYNSREDATNKLPKYLTKPEEIDKELEEEEIDLELEKGTRVKVNYYLYRLRTTLPPEP